MPRGGGTSRPIVTGLAWDWRPADFTEFFSFSFLPHADNAGAWLGLGQGPIY